MIAFKYCIQVYKINFSTSTTIKKCFITMHTLHFYFFQHVKRGIYMKITVLWIFFLILISINIKLDFLYFQLCNYISFSTKNDSADNNSSNCFKVYIKNNIYIILNTTWLHVNHNNSRNKTYKQWHIILKKSSSIKWRMTDIFF